MEYKTFSIKQVSGLTGVSQNRIRNGTRKGFYRKLNGLMSELANTAGLQKRTSE